MGNYLSFVDLINLLITADLLYVAQRHADIGKTGHKHFGMGVGWAGAVAAGRLGESGSDCLGCWNCAGYRRAGIFGDRNAKGWRVGDVGEERVG